MNIIHIVIFRLTECFSTSVIHIVNCRPSRLWKWDALLRRRWWNRIVWADIPHAISMRIYIISKYEYIHPRKSQWLILYTSWLAVYLLLLLWWIKWIALLSGHMNMFFLCMQQTVGYPKIRRFTTKIGFILKDPPRSTWEFPKKRRRGSSTFSPSIKCQQTQSMSSHFVAWPRLGSFNVGSPKSPSVSRLKWSNLGGKYRPLSVRWPHGRIKSQPLGYSNRTSSRLRELFDGCNLW
jgi:hypothetical protein